MGKKMLSAGGGGSMLYEAYMARRKYMFDAKMLEDMYDTMIYRITACVGLCHVLCCNVEDVLIRKGDRRFDRDRKMMMRYVEMAQRSIPLVLDVSMDFVRDLHFRLYKSHKRNINSVFNGAVKYLKVNGCKEPELCAWLSILTRFAQIVDEIYMKGKDDVFGVTNDFASCALKSSVLPAVRNMRTSVKRISVLLSDDGMDLDDPGEELIRQFVKLSDKIILLENFSQAVKYAEKENSR